MEEDIATDCGILLTSELKKYVLDMLSELPLFRILLARAWRGCQYAPANLAQCSQTRCRRSKERIMFLEHRAISEFWRMCDTLKCSDEMHATSGCTLRRLIDRVWWDEITDRSELLRLLRKVGGARDPEDDCARPPKHVKSSSSGKSPMCFWHSIRHARRDRD